MQYTPYQIMLILQRQGIAAGARDVYDKEIGWLTRVGPSVRLRTTETNREQIVHKAGEDNEVIFGQLLGLSGAQIDDLKERQVLR